VKIFRTDLQGSVVGELLEFAGLFQQVLKNARLRDFSTPARALVFIALHAVYRDFI